MNMYGRVKQKKSSWIKICLRYVSCYVFSELFVSQFWLFCTSSLCKRVGMHLFHYFNFICLRYVSCPVFYVLWANVDIFGRHHCAKELGCTCFIISTSVQHKIKLLENLSVELALLKLIRFWMLLVGNCRDGITQNRFELLTECSHLFALQDRSFKVTQILDVVSYQLWDKR